MGVGQQAFGHGHRQIWDAGFFDERTNSGIGLRVCGAFAKKDERTLGAFEQVERAFDRVWSRDLTRYRVYHAYQRFLAVCGVERLAEQLRRQVQIDAARTARHGLSLIHISEPTRL